MSDHYTPFDVERLPAMYAAYRERYSERDERYEIIDDAVAGLWSIQDPDEEDLEVASPNFVQVALEDTAESASLMPTLRVQDTTGTADGKKQAIAMEEIGASYQDANEFDLLVQRILLDLGAYGLAAATILPDYEETRVLIERRDPRTCYPEPGHRPGDTARRCIFARESYVSQLPQAWKDASGELYYDVAASGGYENAKVTIVEYYDEYEIVTGILWEVASDSGWGSNITTVPVEVDRVEHKIGVCPVVAEGRLSLDAEWRGQYDQIVDIVKSYIRLVALILDYADQAVYSDIWVRDLIGEMPYGGGAYIELGPNGAIGRVPPAVSSLNLQADLERLVDSIHLGGRWPKARPGEIDQSQASAKFLESSAGMMNTAIRTYHMIMRRFIEKTLRIAFHVDQAHFAGEQVGVGILRNQMFTRKYNPKTDINLDQRIRVEYGLGLGKDPAQSAVIHIQYGAEEYISDEFVQENIEGITDVARERQRIDQQQFRKMMLAKLLMGLETGQIPNKALVEIMRAREKGEPLDALFEKYVVEPEEEALQTQVDPGLGGGPIQPGAGPEGAGGALPPAPPGGADLMARLNTPAGAGGTLGTQVMGGPNA